MDVVHSAAGRHHECRLRLRDRLFKSRSVPLEQFLDDTIQRSKVAADRMKGAKRVADVRAASNYSYSADTMFGPDHVLIGDAFAFIDPVFSSGVHIALNSALLSSEVVTARLREPEKAKALERKMVRLSLIHI